jgi:hypothetical protein
MFFFLIIKSEPKLKIISSIYLNCEIKSQSNFLQVKSETIEINNFRRFCKKNRNKNNFGKLE